MSIGALSSRCIVCFMAPLFAENLTPGSAHAYLGEGSAAAGGAAPFAAAQEDLFQDQERRTSMAGTSVGLSNLVSGKFRHHIQRCVMHMAMLSCVSRA